MALVETLCFLKKAVITLSNGLVIFSDIAAKIESGDEDQDVGCR